MLRQLCALGAFLVCAVSVDARAQALGQAERESALEIFRRVISFDTSVDGGQNPAMAADLAERFRAGGFAADDVHVLPLGDTAGLLVRYRGNGAEARPILLIAHMDVVPARREEWERDPFTLIEEDGHFFARGASDNKAGIVHLTQTFLSLSAEGFLPERDLLIWFSGDEETTGATTQALVAEHRELIGEPEYALNADAGGGQIDAQGAVLYALQTAEKTYASFTFTVRNEGGHSSVPRADNAIYTLAEALQRLRAFQFPMQWNDTTIGGFRAAGQADPSPAGRAARRFADHPGDRTAARAMSFSPFYNSMLRTTCVATMLAAGHAENALPQTATATVNCRIFPGVSVDDVASELRAIAGENVEIAQLGASSASEASPLRADILAATARAVRTVHANAELAPFMSAGATDGLYLRAAGIPTYGVGGLISPDEDDFAHGLNERVAVGAFYNGLTHWRVLLTELVGRPPGP
jgi:acetylornithine deacetylase/succinyl-diaminopimelate desuccinylase-like protein